MDATCQFTTLDVDRESEDAPRLRQARLLQQAEEIGFWWQSQRQVALQLRIPDSTFRYWLDQYHQRCHSRRGAHALAQFCESPEGLTFLQQMLAALHLVFVEANDCGLRSIGWFLELSGLDEFLPPSYGAQQAFAVCLETLLAEFGQQEDQRLAAQMPPQAISVVEDETFHPQICLVCIEPVSNFLLLEQYAPQRDAATWAACLKERLSGWPVTICQVTSDEAKALIAHAQTYLGAHHSPDLFHVQHDTVQATGLALASQTRRAHQAWAEAQRQTAQCREEQVTCQAPGSPSPPDGPNSPPLEQALAAEAAAQQHRAACQQRQQQATEARRGLSHDYHPIDLETGQPVEAEEVARRLNGHFDRLDQIAEEAKLSAQARQKLAKARRLVDSLQSTIVFFWTTVLARLAAWQCSAAVTAWLREELIPGLYLERAAEKASPAAERQRLRTRAAEILARARSPDGVWGTLSAAQRADLEAKARECAALFQRSSSCVEGRNGQLSLRHHGLHRLTARKLRALRVIHNYLVRRRDGTTAAERFFGTRPQPLFAWLLVRLPLPARPRTSRRAA